MRPISTSLAAMVEAEQADTPNESPPVAVASAEPRGYREAAILAALVQHNPTKCHSRLPREAIQQLVYDVDRSKQPNFGNLICRGNARRAELYNHIAAMAMRSQQWPIKNTEVVSKCWSLDKDLFLQQRVNLQPREQRASFCCVPG